MSVCPTCGSHCPRTDWIEMTMPQFRRRQCLFNGGLVSLTQLETELLSILLMRRGLPTTFNEIVEMLYVNVDAEPDWARNCVGVVLHRLRKKLPDLIFTRDKFGPMIDRPGDRPR